MKKVLLLLFLAFHINANAQLNPAITSWILNQGETGFNNIPSNVLQVQYSTANVYVSCNSIPSYAIGPWPSDPWLPDSQNFVFKITLNPQQNNGPLFIAPYGHIGIWKNGVSIYNPKDAKSYLTKNTWYQNAFYFEGNTFDNCLGHPNQLLEYHTHVNPRCLYTVTDSSQHAPILGYAFDGFPIYGAWGFRNADGSGGVTRMKTSYRLRNITDRTILPDGTVLPDSLFGPGLGTYPLGAYVEDYEYVQGLGDLDIHNGRFCVTPEYPNGIYAYFVALDDALEPIYPYVLGPRYYGTVQPGNLGANSGHNSVSEQVELYTSVSEQQFIPGLMIYPNPAAGNFFITTNTAKGVCIELFNQAGQRLQQYNSVSQWPFEVETTNLLNGLYYLKIIADGKCENVKLVLVK